VSRIAWHSSGTAIRSGFGRKHLLGRGGQPDTLAAMRWLLLTLVGACSFSTHEQGQNGGGSDAAVDAPSDGLSATCTPSTTACDGRVRKVCGASGTWDPSQDTTCDFTCSAGACVTASNVAITDVATCGPSAPALAPPAGATVTVTSSGGTDHIDCAPDCGNGVTRIDRVATANSMAWFCVSSIALPAGVTMTVPATGGPSEAIVFIVDGTASIAGTIDFDGGDASSAVPGGRGAPGGFDGSDLTSSSDSNGFGPCAGNGGHHSGSSDHWIGGGGGGGGLSTSGAGGGGGKCTNSDHTTTGGNASTASCGTPELIPLAGGSGGGAGGDATVNVQQGWAGGGGGGAIQISSRLGIKVAGSIHARGGAGYGQNTIDGGGGGGAGGAILLEAPALSLPGMLVVDGGAGGPSGSGPGGAGETGTTPAGPGATYATSGQGGSGGGGGGGRIRLNAASAMCPAGVSPAASCTTGTLALQ